MNDHGSAILSALLVGVLLIAMMIWYPIWSHSRAEAEVHRFATQNAFDYADSGINVAAQRLKAPDLELFLPPAPKPPLDPQPKHIKSGENNMPDTPNGRYEVELFRNPFDSSLVDAYSTGYYYLPKGAFDDNGKKAQIAVIHVLFRITNVQKYLAAVPNTLHIAYGIQATGGAVYGDTLVFDTCSAPCGSPTVLGTAYYHTGYSPPDLSGSVTFTDDPYKIQSLSFPPSFSALQGPISEYYKRRGDPPPATGFSGPVQASPSSVYWFDGDLTIGQNGPLSVDGVFIIYATGNITIKNAIIPTPSLVGRHWAGILSEKEIHIADSAPSNLTLNGNFVSNGAFTADGSTNAAGRSLTINGGMVSITDIAFDGGFDNRTYTYDVYPGTDLLLPNFSNVLQYDVLRGSQYQ